MRHTAISLIMLLLASTAWAAEVSDSLSRALATYWGASIKVSSMTPEQRKQFSQGMEEAVNAANDSVREAYYSGVLYGARLRASLMDMEKLGLKADASEVGEALAKVINGENVGFTAETARDYLDRLISPQGERLTPESQEQFIAEAAKTPGAETTPSGLVFITLKEGEGANPTEDQKVVINYEGKLSTGEVFDKTEEPVTFDLVNLVPGFSEGLKMMQPGGTYRIVIPARLGYGERGASGVIPPGAALDFTVTLLYIIDEDK